MKIIRILVSLLFLFTGLPKLLALPMAIAGFSHWGYPLWFMSLIGGLEVAGAIGLWLPRLSPYANLGLLGLMVGAFYTHLSTGDPLSMMALAIVASLFLLLHLYLYLRKSRLVTDLSSQGVKG